MFAWMTARRIKPGKMAEFKREWEGGPEARRTPGVRADYFFQDSSDPNLMIGISLWEDRGAYERFVASPAEAGRRKAMSPHVEAVEWERFFEVVQYDLPPP